MTQLAVLDIVPTGEAFRQADMAFSLGYWVWTFLAAPEPVPEQLITHAPAILVDHMLDTWSNAPDVFPADLRAEYVAQFRDPDRVHAICEEYPAAATLDYEHDEADRGTRRIACPRLSCGATAVPSPPGTGPSTSGRTGPTMSAAARSQPGTSWPKRPRMRRPGA